MDVYGCKAFQNLPGFATIDRKNLYIDSFNKNKTKFNEIYRFMSIVGYMKILMDVLEVDIVEMEDKLSA